MQHHSASAQRRIPYSPETVFALVSDPEKQPEWLASRNEGAPITFKIRHAAGPRAGVGGRYLRLADNAVGRSEVDRFETTSYEKPWHVAYSDGVSFDLAPDGDGTVLTCRHDKELGTSLGRMVRRMLRTEPPLATDQDIAGDLERIERVLANGRPW